MTKEATKLWTDGRTDTPWYKVARTRLKAEMAEMNRLLLSICEYFRMFRLSGWFVISDNKQVSVKYMRVTASLYNHTLHHFTHTTAFDQ